MNAPILIPTLPPLAPETSAAQFARVFQHVQSVRAQIYAQWTRTLRETIRRAEDEEARPAEGNLDVQEQHDHQHDQSHPQLRLYDAALKEVVSDFSSVNALIRTITAAIQQSQATAVTSSASAHRADLSSILAAVTAIQSLEASKLKLTVRLHQVAVVYEVQRRTPFDEEYTRTSADIRSQLNHVVAEINERIDDIRNVQFAQT